jgi:hypothetical protein
MSNTKQKDDLIGYQTWNKSVTLYASTDYPDDPVLYESFLHIVGNSWWIESWDGTQWNRVCQLEPSEILTLLLTVDGASSGLDADKLDGQEGSYYQNASNLNAGTILRARLGALWRDTDSNQTDSPYIQSGKATIASGTGTQTINFDYAYSETPRITIGSGNALSLTILAIVSTTGFIIEKKGVLYDLNWIAIGRKA